MHKLLSARFWMAITLTCFFCLGFANGEISGEMFTGVAMVVVTFYFKREDRRS